MHNSVIVKMLALVLAMVSLFTLVVSGTGIVALLGEDLYERYIEDVYQERIQSRVQWFASEAAWRYASTELGGLPEEAVEQYHGFDYLDNIFRWGEYGYTIYDENGHILATREKPESGTVHKVVIENVNHLCLVEGSQRYPNLEAQEAARQETLPPMVSVPEAATEPLEHSQGQYLEPIPATVLEFTNVRNEPSLAGSILGVAEKGMELELLQQVMSDGSLWGFVKFGDGGGWLLMDTVVLGNPVTAAVAQVEKDEPETAISGVAIEDIAIYSVPNVGGNELGTLSAGTSITILRTERVNKETWGLMTEGWVQMDKVETGNASDQETTAPEEETVAATEAEKPPEATEAAEETVGPTEETKPDLTIPVRVQAEETVNIYEEPDYYSPVLDELPLGDITVVNVQERIGGMLWGQTDEGWLLMNGVEILEVMVPETTAATVPETIPEETAQVLETEAAEQAPAPLETFGIGYHDGQRGEYTEIQAYELGSMPDAALPDITVELYLTYDPLPDNGYWMLLRRAYYMRDVLIKAAVASLVVLILMLVYLCCAAGRKPKSDEVRAGGLNRIPLDLYLFGGGFGVIGLIALAANSVQYTMNYEQLLGEVLAGGSIALACVITIAMFFAFVAQIKTPGGYWYCNTITGRCAVLVYRCCTWLGGKYDDKMAPGIVKLLRGCWHIVVVLWRYLVKAVVWTTGKLEAGMNKLGKACGTFFRMLPLTWQWLLAGGVMLGWVFIATAGRYEMGIVLGLFFALVLILYGSHCFGLLLDSAKKMRKGDLDSKVEDKLLTGSFKDFAEELNGLADVAVVAAQKQLKSERMKTELITNVSHDIKTPLTSIINYVDLLQKPHTDEEAKQYLEVLDRQSQRLKKLVDDLMEMSKASTGNLPVEVSIVNATEAVNQALGEFADKLDRADLVSVFRKPEYPVYMMADGRLVWRVLSNLLSNAVKYALPGTRVYLDLVETDGMVILSIKNVSREELNISADELLERFVRGDTSRNTEGSGLGLNIAKSLVELQKGQMQLLVDGDLFKVTLMFPGVKLD